MAGGFMEEAIRAGHALRGKVVIQGLVFDWISLDGDLEVSHSRYGRRVAALDRFDPCVLARLVAIGMIAEPDVQL
jgi:hypothetical protein